MRCFLKWPLLSEPIYPSGKNQSRDREETEGDVGSYDIFSNLKGFQELLSILRQESEETNPDSHRYAGDTRSATRMTYGDVPLTLWEPVSAVGPRRRGEGW